MTNGKTPSVRRGYLYRNERGLPRHNEHTIVSAAQVKNHLLEVRTQGHALDDEEDELGYRRIGCPAFHAGGRVIAAISVAGATSQIPPTNVLRLMRELTKASASITSTLAKKTVSMQIRRGRNL